MLVTSRGNKTSWYDFNAKTFTQINSKNGLPPESKDFLYVQDAIPLQWDRAILATNNGLLELNMVTRRMRYITLFNRGKPIDPTSLCYDLFLDRDKKVWLIQGNGLISFSPFDETIGLIRSSAPHREWPNSVRNFVEDSIGNIWIATSRGFGYWDLKKNTIKIFEPESDAQDRLNQPSVRGLNYDGRMVIMGTSSAGAWLYEPKSQKISKAIPTVLRKMENPFRKFLNMNL